MSVRRVSRGVALSLVVTLCTAVALATDPCKFPTPTSSPSGLQFNRAPQRAAFDFSRVLVKQPCTTCVVPQFGVSTGDAVQPLMLPKAPGDGLIGGEPACEMLRKTLDAVVKAREVDQALIASYRAEIRQLTARIAALEAAKNK